MVFVKGQGLYTDIGKRARDLLYKDYQGDQKFTLTTFTSNGVAITSSGSKKGEIFLADVNTQLKNKNITTDVKVDTNSNVYTTITIDDPDPRVSLALLLRTKRLARWNFNICTSMLELVLALALLQSPLSTSPVFLVITRLPLGLISRSTLLLEISPNANGGVSLTTADLIASSAL